MAGHNQTTVLLRQWEHGSTGAERMCADILRIEGYASIDPQCPLGGPDGGKDILCEKDGTTFVAGCHFPTDNVPFTKSRTKFDADLAASLKHKRDGFIFLTNQKVSPSERRQLEGRAAKKGKIAIIYERERLRLSLDSAQGYSIRLRHLGLSMTVEEQAAYFASSNDGFAAALAAQTRAIEQLAAKIDRMASGNAAFMVQTASVIAGAAAGSFPSEDLAKMLRESAASLHDRVEDAAEPLSANLTTPFIKYVHRVLLGANPRIAGHWRVTKVWLEHAHGPLDAPPTFPEATEVPAAVEKLISDWNGCFHHLVSREMKQKIESLARFFHRLVSIHPFIDGNGRLARAILALQARDLFDLDDDILLDRGADYYAALRSADAGDISRLSQLIEHAVEYAAWELAPGD